MTCSWRTAVVSHWLSICTYHTVCHSRHVGDNFLSVCYMAWRQTKQSHTLDFQLCRPPSAQTCLQSRTDLHGSVSCQKCWKYSPTNSEQVPNDCHIYLSIFFFTPMRLSSSGLTMGLDKYFPWGPVLPLFCGLWYAASSLLQIIFNVPYPPLLLPHSTFLLSKWR